MNPVASLLPQRKPVLKKRGPDELLSSIHGTILAPVMTVDSEAKKAFVEYEDEHSAVGFVTSMNAVPIQIRGRTIFAQYSTHQELRLDKNRSAQDTGADVSFLLVLERAGERKRGGKKRSPVQSWEKATIIRISALIGGSVFDQQCQNLRQGQCPNGKVQPKVPTH
ncbi:hypothetical protein NECAME_08209 [Necator americanus]|uniref:RRM domain-containing protein n=1 Tax=Necator americanus TaxID=51031 RepID=W2TLP1_NECAM|nr:hypothetical protein NECAME_08209 [Necator americanus]ETN82056.1 hypothetical protein NECAME_08209 [Necator americanus]